MRSSGHSSTLRGRAIPPGKESPLEARLGGGGRACLVRAEARIVSVLSQC